MLTGGQLGDTIKLQVTATNSQGSASADSNTLGTVTAAPVSGPTTAQIRTDLNEVAHPSGTKAITALLKQRSFKASFTAPAAGSLSITWTTTVTTGTGRHRKHRKVTVASGSATCQRRVTRSVTVRLTAAGRSLLRRRRTPWRSPPPRGSAGRRGPDDRHKALHV